MVKTRRFQLRVVALSAMLVFALSGCVYDPYYSGPPLDAHYHPHHHDYYYYPGVRVYFHFTTGYYYYHHRKRWRRTRVLPPRIHIDPRDRVRLRIDTDRPYIKHKEHRQRYVPAPRYQPDKKRSLKEREANRKWYKEYREKRGKKKYREERIEKNRKR